MKAILKSTIMLVLLTGLCIHSHAQPVSNTTALRLGQVAPYRMEVTYNKTTHLIFPAAIRYVDLGSDELVAGKADDAENVLRVKAAVRDFSEETNFSVITDDGRFYNFDVLYSPYPSILNYDLMKMQRSADRERGNEVLFTDLGKSAPSLAQLLMETICKQNKRDIKHIGSRSYGIGYTLKGIYIHEGKFYFFTELRNKTNVPFRVDFVRFKVVDKKVLKRSVIQERTQTPLRQYRPNTPVAGKASGRNVFLLDLFSITGDQVLLIEICEQNGGRHQVLRVEQADLEKAKLVSYMHLKIR
ncbi:conjugative transposon protein TraN [Chitinophaga caeni]|uniref:Conjugative transposon protein TraN n=1 Tax=Chitinophaga caeni TaxID=2029983 RepID=A0A291QYJ7_9BACT|nr:conjugative transposon protein TraN [Chitinophaga caeni]ATL48943.1 conjugative transposon protein TraN [Chitinophaga caeni]